MQCPHIGICGSDPGIVCCLTYHDNHQGSGFESFFSGTCKTFLCTAWNELTDRQVLFAAELMKDWYYYSLLINSLEILMDLCAEYESPHDVQEEILEELKIELKEKLFEDDLIWKFSIITKENSSRYLTWRQMPLSPLIIFYIFTCAEYLFGINNKVIKDSPSAEIAPSCTNN